MTTQKVILLRPLLHLHPGYQTLQNVSFLGRSGTHVSQCAEQGKICVSNLAVDKLKMGNTMWQTCCLSEVSSSVFLENSLMICKYTWSAFENSKTAKFS